MAPSGDGPEAPTVPPKSRAIHMIRSQGKLTACLARRVRLALDGGGARPGPAMGSQRWPKADSITATSVAPEH